MRSVNPLVSLPCTGLVFVQDMRAFTIVLVFVLLVSSVSFMNLLGEGTSDDEGFNVTDNLQYYGKKNTRIGHEEYEGPYISLFTSFRLLLGDFDPSAYLEANDAKKGAIIRSRSPSHTSSLLRYPCLAAVNLATLFFAATMFFVNIVL